MKTTILSGMLILFGWLNFAMAANSSEPEELQPFSVEEIQKPPTTMEEPALENRQPEELKPFSTREIQVSPEENPVQPFTSEETSSSSTTGEELAPFSSTDTTNDEGIIPSYREDDSQSTELPPLDSEPEPAASLELPEERNWHVLAGYKAWLNQWQLSLYPRSDSPFIKRRLALTSEPELVSMLSLTLKTHKFSLSGSFLPKQTYQFSETSLIRVYEYNPNEPQKNTEVSILNAKVSAERQEWSIMANYEIISGESGGSLSIGAGMKRVDYEYEYISRLPPFSQSVRMSGPSLNISGSVPLLYNRYGILGLYGNFAYGAYKTKSYGYNDYTPYFLTEVGLSYTYPFKKQTGFLYSATAIAGYRSQSFYSESANDDALDTTEGFVLGVFLTF